MSLPLADQKLGSHSNAESTSHKFMLKGRQSGGMHRGHAWVFRAESYDTMLAWFSDIKDLTEKTGAERKEFIRRSHARSVSAGSHKAGSISSDGGIDEDEADAVPYSATASQAEIVPHVEKLPQRPNPGGRFPSALKTNRDSQMPVSPSSPSSSAGDRDLIAAAGALPGSGVPFSSSEQQVHARDDETNFTGGGSDGVSAAPLATKSRSPDSPMASKQGPESLPLNSAGAAGAKERSSSAQVKSIPFNVDQQYNTHGDWLAGVGGGAIGVTGNKRYGHDLKQKGSAAHEDQSGLESVPATNQVPAPSLQESGGPPVQGAIFAAFPSTLGGTDDMTNKSTSPNTGKPSSDVPDSASPIEDLASRPSLGSRVATISELHVPGEYPKGYPATKST